MSNNNSRFPFFQRLNMRIHSSIANTFHGARADSVAWRRQNFGHQTNPMYNHIYLGGIGTLLDHYEQRESDEAFQKLLVRRFERMLYNRGAGKILSKQEYARFWKTLRNADSVSSGIILSLFHCIHYSHRYWGKFVFSKLRLYLTCFII